MNGIGTASTRKARTARHKGEKIFTFAFINIMAADLLIRICTFMLIALVPLYVIDMGYSATVAGLTTTLYMGAAVLLRPLSGTLSDTKGRFLVMLIGSAVYCFATGFYIFAIPVWLLLLVRALQGFGFSFNGTALMTLATDVIPESRMSEGIGYLGLTQTIAQAFAPGLALLLKDAFGYRVAFIVLFGLALLNLLARFPLRKIDDRRTFQPVEPAHQAADAERVPLWQRIVDKDALRPSALMFVIMFATTGINTFLVAYAIGRGMPNPGAFFTVTAIMVAVARLSVGRLHQRLGTVWIIAPGIGLISIGLLTIFLAPNVYVLIVAGALYGMGIGAVQPAINSLAVLSARKESRGLANSTFFMAMDLAQAIAAVVLGALASVAGMGIIFSVGAGVSTLALVAYLILRPREAQTDDEQQSEQDKLNYVLDEE